MPAEHDPVTSPSHYAGDVQPIQLIESMRLGWHEGNVVKYVSRWREKGGVEDLKKAAFILDRLIAREEGEEREPPFPEHLRPREEEGEPPTERRARRRAWLRSLPYVLHLAWYTGGPLSVLKRLAGR